MKRILEPETMDTIEEVVAYDRILKLYHFWLSRPPIKIVSKLIGQKGGKLILDIGTGTARIPIGIAKINPQCKIYAVDNSFNMLKVAYENIRKEGLENKIILKQADAKSLPFENNFFDIVTCCNMLHHLKDPLVVLNEINRVVKQDGVFVISDLIRPASKFILNLFMCFLAFPYNRCMRKEYLDSLRAAFTVNEFKHMISSSDIKKARIYIKFPHFITIVKEQA